MKKFTQSVAFATALGTTAACTSPASVTTEQQRVEQTLITMVDAIDDKQWTLASEKFAQTVFVDYSSLNGQPGAEVSGESLVNGWKNLLQMAETKHTLSEIKVSIDGSQASVTSKVYATHQAKSIEPWDVYGSYQHRLARINDAWQIIDMTFVLQGQKGNLEFLQQAMSMADAEPKSKLSDKVEKKRVSFYSEGQKVVGDLYLPRQIDTNKQYPAIVVSGSWTTVKEQMSGLYAEKLANNGFVALAFDPRNFGESEGVVRFHENPRFKVSDISSAVSFLQSRSEVDQSKIGALGICAGSMYTLMAATEDKRIKSVVTVASWLHDAEAVKLFYGGEQGVKNKIDAARKAKQQFVKTGNVEYIPSISTTDESAAMYGPYDYYLNPRRGAVPEWSADKFAVATWEDWLTLDPMPTAAKLTTPTLMVHSDGAVLPQYTKQYFDKIATSNKRLHWIDTEMESPFHQFSFYDQPTEVNISVKEATAWFKKL